MKRPVALFTATLAVAALCAGFGALAAPPHEWRGGPPAQFDGRYHHDHYYPVRGYVSATLPGGAISVAFGNGHYFFHGGVWYSPYGPRYRVVVPPVGIVVPILPAAYATLWIAGAPYYYANGTYYAPAPAGYAVVAPPPGAETAQPVPPAPPPKPAPDAIVYPRNGQSPQQTEADRQECDRWATTQASAMADASVFQRAVGACLDARGYTVR